MRKIFRSVRPARKITLSRDNMCIRHFPKNLRSHAQTEPLITGRTHYLSAAPRPCPRIRESSDFLQLRNYCYCTLFGDQWGGPVGHLSASHQSALGARRRREGTERAAWWTHSTPGPPRCACTDTWVTHAPGVDAAGKAANARYTAGDDDDDHRALQLVPVCCWVFPPSSLMGERFFRRYS